MHSANVCPSARLSPRAPGPQVPCVAVVENMSYFEADGKRYFPFGQGSGEVGRGWEGLHGRELQGVLHWLPRLRHSLPSRASCRACRACAPARRPCLPALPPRRTLRRSAGPPLAAPCHARAWLASLIGLPPGPGNASLAHPPPPPPPPATAGERIQREFGLPNLVRFPIVPDLSAAGDSGRPVVVTDPTGPTAQAFLELGAAVVREVGRGGARVCVHVHVRT